MADLLIAHLATSTVYNPVMQNTKSVDDKFLHCAAFGMLGVLALRVAATPLEGAWWLLGLFAGGWLIACLQALVPTAAFRGATWARTRPASRWTPSVCNWFP
jgi:hypothetical protein